MTIAVDLGRKATKQTNKQTAQTKTFTPVQTLIYHGDPCTVYRPLPGFHLICLIKSELAYFSTKTYVVGTQKNRLDETVLLSTQIIC